MKKDKDWKIKDTVLAIDEKLKPLGIYHKIGKVVYIGNVNDKKLGIEFSTKITPKQKIPFPSKTPDQAIILGFKQIVRVPKDLKENQIDEFLKSDGVKPKKAHPKKKDEVEIIEKEEEGDEEGAEETHEPTTQREELPKEVHKQPPKDDPKATPKEEPKLPPKETPK